LAQLLLADPTWSGSAGRPMGKPAAYHVLSIVAVKPDLARVKLSVAPTAAGGCRRGLTQQHGRGSRPPIRAGSGSAGVVAGRAVCVRSPAGSSCSSTSVRYTR
jgi:hypothetical protein